MFSLAAKSLLTRSRSHNNRFFHASSSQLAKLNVEGLAEKVNLEGQNVLMRVDLNVPLSKEVRMILCRGTLEALSSKQAREKIAFG